MLRVPLLLAVTWALLGRGRARYEPTWESLDTRPIPAWYDEAKFGIFLHWGVYSVPSFGDAWFWQQWRGDKDKAHVEFMRRNYRPGFTYADFAPQFTAEFFEPDRWADLFAAAGARYVVLTTKHHEGFTLWPSKYAWSWNAVDTGPKRDLVGDLGRAVRNRTNIRFGVYHSLFEFFNPHWLADKASNFTQNTFPAAKTIPELYELVYGYEPDVIWSDGSSQAPSSDYWGSKQFLAWLYNDSPIRDRVVTNDRWGTDCGCKHGDFITCHDHYNPGVLQKHKWENCMTVDRYSWGYRRDISLASIRSMEELTRELAETVSCGGNLLLNVGPTHDGRIVPIFEERLRQMGQWLNISGEAIYASRPWVHQNDSVTPGVWYTQREGRVYAIVLDWPPAGRLRLGSLRLRQASGRLTLLGFDGGPLQWRQRPGAPLLVQLPPLEKVSARWAWVVRAENAVAPGDDDAAGVDRSGEDAVQLAGGDGAGKTSEFLNEITLRKFSSYRQTAAFWQNTVAVGDSSAGKKAPSSNDAKPGD
ncbi:alpha-L-fucosidase-like [Pollicipes pollicipes]|uniref:alpha-L-fucosidase-like n=1 Tax=Pollicipes pollicipes TaxID=41117 RepID=UPI0018859306|nr:alpha-L-fucosidase-like [Pollicipes pollicipes]